MGSMLHFMYIKSDQPPETMPLTLGCMPVLFVGIGEVPENPAPSAGRYANPRVKVPCPQISWPKLSNPKKHQKTAVLTCLAEIINPKAIYLAKLWISLIIRHRGGADHTVSSFWNVFLKIDEGSTPWTPFGPSKMGVSWDWAVATGFHELSSRDPPLCLSRVSSFAQVTEPRIPDMRIHPKPPQQESVCGIQGQAKTLLAQKVKIVSIL